MYLNIFILYVPVYMEAIIRDTPHLEYELQTLDTHRPPV